VNYPNFVGLTQKTWILTKIIAFSRIIDAETGFLTSRA